jgi:two-component sensor histidine kinase
MTYSDDGPGFPPEVLAGQRSSLGIYLLRTLAAHDLRGALELRNDGGALVTLRMSSALGLKRISE